MVGAPLEDEEEEGGWSSELLRRFTGSTGLLLRERERKKRFEDDFVGCCWVASVLAEGAEEEGAVEDAASDLSDRFEAKTAAMRRMGRTRMRARGLGRMVGGIKRRERTWRDERSGGLFEGCGEEEQSSWARGGGGREESRGRDIVAGRREGERKDRRQAGRGQTAESAERSLENQRRLALSPSPVGNGQGGRLAVSPTRPCSDQPRVRPDPDRSLQVDSPRQPTFIITFPLIFGDNLSDVRPSKPCFCSPSPPPPSHDSLPMRPYQPPSRRTATGPLPTVDRVRACAHHLPDDIISRPSR